MWLALTFQRSGQSSCRCFLGESLIAHPFMHPTTQNLLQEYADQYMYNEIDGGEEESGGHQHQQQEMEQ